MHGPTCIFWANLTPFTPQGGALAPEHITKFVDQVVSQRDESVIKC